MDLALTIAIYKLRTSAPYPKVEADDKDAMRMLCNIASGTLKLSVAGIETPDTGGSGAQTVSAAVSVTYNPITDNHESGTFYVWIETTRYMLPGARGNCKIMFGAQGIPCLMLEFTGLFTQPAETARGIPTLNLFQKPQLATKANTPTFTLNAVAFVLRELTLDLGNQIEPRFLIGSEGILITDKAETLEVTVEAQPLSAFNPKPKWRPKVWVRPPFGRMPNSQGRRPKSPASRPPSTRCGPAPVSLRSFESNTRHQGSDHASDGYGSDTQRRVQARCGSHRDHQRADEASGCV